MKTFNEAATRAGTTALGWTLLLLVCACGSGQPSLTVTPVNNPAPPGAALPNLAAAPDHVVLSWITATASDTGQAAPKSAAEHSLQMARYDAHAVWSSVTTIATGSNWFVNWADFPSVYALDERRLAAHWLRRSGEGTYAYDVVTSLSSDGKRWSPGVVPHLDGSRTEHGFASFFTQHGEPAIAWLDGRDTVPDNADLESHGHGSQGGAMTLRTRMLSASDFAAATPRQSTLLDDRVCDCCQTAAVTTTRGAIVFYRDRSAGDIRDIAYTRYDNDTRAWSTPTVLHNDGWQINGCPVNGPQADATEDTVAVAWFTASPTPRVQIALSHDGGEQFSAPVLVSDERPLGRVSLKLIGNRYVLVSWLDRRDVQSNTATLAARLYDTQLEFLDRTEIATVSAERASGFARLAPLGNRGALIAWTGSGDTSAVRTARIDIQ